MDFIKASHINYVVYNTINSSKDAMISFLQVTTSKLQEDYAQLQRSYTESGSISRELSGDKLSLVQPWSSTIVAVFHMKQWEL